MSEEYNFDDAFDNAKREAEDYKKNGRSLYNSGMLRDLKISEKQRRKEKDSKEYKKSKTRSSKISGGVTTKIYNIPIQYNGDTRKNLCITKTCETCSFSIFMANYNKQHGYCLLATKEKSSKQPEPILIPANKKYYKRNKLYTSLNWVHTHSSGYCDEYTPSTNKLLPVKRWLNKHILVFRRGIRYDA